MNKEQLPQHIQEQIEREYPIDNGERPFVPYYKPDGMSEQEYADEVCRHQDVATQWDSNILIQQAAIRGAEIAMENALDYWMGKIPHKTYNCEPFGLMLMPVNGDKWSVCYYTFYSNKVDDRIGTVHGATPIECVMKLYDLLFIKYPEMLQYAEREQIPTPPNKND